VGCDRMRKKIKIDHAAAPSPHLTRMAGLRIIAERQAPTVPFDQAERNVHHRERPAASPGPAA
jgi:hypothetical protein